MDLTQTDKAWLSVARALPDDLRLFLVEAAEAIVEGRELPAPPVRRLRARRRQSAAAAPASCS